jgi:hypothetical protein
MPGTRPPYGRRPESRSDLVPRAGRPRPPVEQRSHDSALTPNQGETYYGLSPGKAAHYGWLISGYFFTGGASPASRR